VDQPINVYTPSDVLRRVTAMGVLANALTIWSYMRSRLEEAYPERAATAGPAELPLDEETFADWLDDFVDTAEAERSRLARRLNPEG
jgi:hypothetical protein